MAKWDKNFPWDMEEFIIRPHRNRLLRRILLRPQYHFEEFFNNIDELNTLRNPVTIREDLIDYLAFIVGWNWDLETLWNRLSTEDKRKLITASADIWKKKGTETGIVEAINFIVGRWPVIYNWFWYRWIVGETGLWWNFEGSDPWITGGTLTNLDEFLSSIFIMDEGGIDYDLVKDLVELIRPVGEHYEITYVDFLDDFAGDLSLWNLVSGNLPEILSYQMRIQGVTNVIAYPDSFASAPTAFLKNTSKYLFTFIQSAPNQTWAFICNSSTGNDGTVFEINTGLNQIRLGFATSYPGVVGWAVTNPLASPIVAGQVSQITVEIDHNWLVPGVSSQVRYRVWVDSNLNIDHTIVYAFPFEPSGTFAFYNNTGPLDNLDIDNVRAFTPPLRIDLVP